MYNIIRHSKSTVPYHHKRNCDTPYTDSVAAHFHSNQASELHSTNEEDVGGHVQFGSMATTTNNNREYKLMRRPCEVC
jgi:hypothetical protein